MLRLWITATLLAVALHGLEEASAPMPPPTWNYDDPSKWAGACSSGQEQSPLDFRMNRSKIVKDRHLSPLYLTSACRFVFSDYKLTLTSNYRTLEVKVVPTGNGTSRQICAVQDPMTKTFYPFIRMHFHANGGEHLFGDMKDGDAELHLVFQTPSDDRTLVVAVRLRASGKAKVPSAAAKVFHALLQKTHIPPAGATIQLPLQHDLFLDALLPSWDAGYITYNGSLTTPPCTQGVRWVVLTSPQAVPASCFLILLNALRSYMPNFDDTGNSRPPQLLNHRVCHRFIDPFHSPAQDHWILSEAETKRFQAKRASGKNGDDDEGYDDDENVHPYFTYKSVSTNGFEHTAFLIVVVMLCISAVGCFIHFRFSKVPAVGVSDTARDAAAAVSYGTMET